LFSRRSFLAASLAVLLEPQFAIAKKKPVAEVKKLGPHTLAREEWAPAITPDFVEIVENGYTLLADQAGRLAVVDLKREEGPRVIGELSGIGKKVIDIAVLGHRLLALTGMESENEQQYSIAIINLAAPGEPSLVERINLPYVTDPTAIAAAGDLVAVGGTVGNRGENQILLFNLGEKRRRDEGNEPLATLNARLPVMALDLHEKQLLVLQGQSGNSALDIYNLNNPRAPQKSTTLKLDGNYSVMARNKDLLALAGTSSLTGVDHKVDIRLIGLHPAPHLVSHQKLPLVDLFDLITQKKQLLALGSQEGRLAVLPVVIGKDSRLAVGQAVVLPSGARGAFSKAHMAANEKEAYVASDSGSLQVLTIKNDSWQYSYSHVVPRLPVASVAMTSGNAVLAGADIKTYDVTDPQHPVLLGMAEPGSVVRSVAVAGSLFLALTRDTLSLRKVAKPAEVVASLKLDGQKMSYDACGHKAYVLAAGEKQTTITPVRVSGSLDVEPAQTLPAVYNRGSAFAGRLLVSGLSNLALYDMADNKQIGARVFPNLALRDLALLGDVAVIAALDASSRGFLLTINTADPALPTIGSVDLPQDAVAISVNGSQAVAIGRDAQGKDQASLVDLSNSAAPRVLATFPVLEAASAVAIRGKLVLVGGRGLEILNL
jgi:hypothetical protein